MGFLNTKGESAMTKEEVMDYIYEKKEKFEEKWNSWEGRKPFMRYCTYVGALLFGYGCGKAVVKSKCDDELEKMAKKASSEITLRSNIAYLNGRHDEAVKIYKEQINEIKEKNNDTNNI